jgi:hypothetical protein
VKSTYADRFVSPTREEIAAQVSASLPGKPRVRVPDPAGDVPPEPAPDGGTLGCFAVHVRTALRVRGWGYKELAHAIGVHATPVRMATEGSACTLDLAAAIADFLGKDLGVMVQPYTCGTCADYGGTPPAGLRCMECGTEGARRE